MAEPGDKVMAAADLGRLFTSVAATVAGAQARLDAVALAGAAEFGAHNLYYAIPRVGFELEFGLQIERGEKSLLWLIPIGERRAELLAHRLRFSLVAAPSPPAEPAPHPAELVFQLLEPHFLLPADDEADFCAQVAAILASGDTGAIKIALTKKKALSATLLRREAERIREALSSPKGGRGMVCFRLDGVPPSYLVARVTDKADNDSLFLYVPDQASALTVYSLEGDDDDQVRYEPLHRFAVTVRNWLAGESPLRATCSRAEAERMGLADLADFADRLLDGYAEGLRFLAHQNSAGGIAQPPILYELSEARAELSYSVQYGDRENAEFNFAQRRTPDDRLPGARYELIRSQATLRAYCAGSSPQIEITLAAPEFALSGSARDEFLRLVAESAEVIAGRFAADFVKANRLDKDGPEFKTEFQRYLTMLTDGEARRAVVALLSYKGKTPQEEFLAIWPGMYQGRHRDFAFTCKSATNGLDKEKIVPVMRMDQELSEVSIGTEVGGAGENSLGQSQYRAFHNFFHAVRIWRGRGR